jgi:hypothetical protein
MDDFVHAFREQNRKQASQAAQIDMLSLFDISTPETWHSAFLAWLLDAEGSHNQSDLFLRTFLDVRRPCPSLAIPEEYHVQTEFWGGEASIDILVYQPQEFLLYVENKTVSPDTRGQLRRELRDMRRLGRAFDIPSARQAAIYLTPAGHMSHPDRDAMSEWHTVSYTDLAQAISALLPGLADAGLKFVLET